MTNLVPPATMKSSKTESSRTMQTEMQKQYFRYSELFYLQLNKGSGYIYITLVTKKWYWSVGLSVAENPNFQLVFEMLF